MSWPRIRFISLVLLPLAFACVRQDDGRKQSYAERGFLVVLTRNAPTTYYEDRDGQAAGIEYDLANAFGRFLGMSVRFKVYNTRELLLEALRTGEGDIAAGGLTALDASAANFSAGPSYQTVRHQVVCGRDVLAKSWGDLQDTAIHVVPSTSYADLQRRVAAKNTNVRFVVRGQATTEQLIAEVAAGDVGCTIADSHIVAVHRRYFPSLKIAFEVEDDQPLVWLTTQDDQSIQVAMERWFELPRTRSTVSMLQDHYYGHTEEYDAYDTQKFRERLSTRLPKLRSFFEEAAAEYGFTWDFLAAVAYQESHWNPKAKSPTGVRGIMMLTRNTARAMGVKNRIDSYQSIMGGARYLRKMIDRIPSYVPEPDRTWMGLASYNVGYAHLRDARSLAVLRELNPNRWPDVAEVLPLLAKPKYYSKLSHGYARGMEPVVYVQNIRNYHDILMQALATQTIPAELRQAAATNAAKANEAKL